LTPAAPKQSSTRGVSAQHLQPGHPTLHAAGESAIARAATAIAAENGATPGRLLRRRGPRCGRKQLGSPSRSHALPVALPDRGIGLPPSEQWRLQLRKTAMHEPQFEIHNKKKDVNFLLVMTCQPRGGAKGGMAVSMADS